MSAGDARPAGAPARWLEYRHVFDQIALGVARVDRDERILWLNGHLASMLGEPAEALVGTIGRALVLAEDVAPLQADADRLRDGHHVARGHEVRIVRRDGTVAWIEVHLARLEDAEGFQGELLVFAKDVSTRKRWEESLIADELRLNSLLSLSQQAHALDEGAIARFALGETVRLTQSELGYLVYVDDDQTTVALGHLHRGDADSGVGPPAGALPLPGKGPWAECIRLRAPVTHNRAATAGADRLPVGHARIRRHVSVPVVEGDQVRMVIGVANKGSDYGPADLRQVQLLASDTWVIVQRRRALDALREGEQRVRAIIDGARDAILTTGLDGAIVDVNEAAVRTYGHPRARLVGAAIAELRAPHELERLEGDWARARAGGAVYETVHRHADGRCFPVEISTQLASLRGAPVVVATVRDLTRQRDLERQLSQAQKLEAIGRLAAGIAHEINTPTQYVGDNLAFLADAFRSMCTVVTELIAAAREGATPAEERLSTLAARAAALDLAFLAEETPRAIEEAREGVRKVAHIVAAMKDFSHPGEESMTPVDLQRALESTVTVTRNVWKRVAEVTVRVPPELPRPPGQIAELNQAFLNLIVNAAQAIAERPEVKAGTLGTIDISAALGPRRDAIEIRVVDSGVGIPEAIRARVFDPFFTTKPVGVGTGQGLALVHHVVVDKHRGAVSFESEVGKGTTFTLELPLRAPSRVGR